MERKVVETEWTGKNNDIAVVYLANKPVNILSLAVFKQFGDIMNGLKENKKCKGVIVLSRFGAKRNVVSGGFDLALFGKVCIILHLN